MIYNHAREITKRRNGFRECILVFALLANHLSGMAQNIGPGDRLVSTGTIARSYIIDNWDTGKGLPSNSLLSLFQSSDGFIWISSYQGVLRFDGSEFVQFNKTNTPSFQTTGVSTIVEDENNRLWFGTYGGGVLKYSNSDFVRSPRELSDQTIGALYCDGENVLVGTRGHGIFCYRNDSLQAAPAFDELKDFMVSAIVRDNKNIIWVGTENKGLIRIAQDKTTTFTVADGLPENKVTSFFIDANETMWMGTPQGIAYMESGRIHVDQSMPRCLVKNIAGDAEGNLWAAAECGLFIREAGTKQWREFLDNNNHRLAASIVDVLPSREGDVWISSYRHGLFRIRYSSFRTISSVTGLSGPTVTAVAEIGTGKMLVGTDNGKIDLVENYRVRHFPIKTKLPDTRVRHILRDRRNNIWIGVSGGLLKISPDGRERWLTKEEGLSDNLVRVLFEARDGTIWIGTRAGGITKIDTLGKFSYLGRTNGFPSDFIMSIDQDESGNMWVGLNESGLVRIVDQEITVFTTKDGLPTNVIYNTYEDKEHTVWVATNSGLVRFKDGEFFTYDAHHGLPNDAPYDVLEDSQGNLWMPTTLGIMKVSKSNLSDVASGTVKSLEVRLYDHQDGIEEPECTATTVSLKAGDGSMWIPTLDGVVVLNADDLPLNKENVRVYINYVTANDERLMPANEIELKPGVKRFSVKYSALNLKAPTKVKFRFKLENFDNQWVEVGSRKEVFFTNLRPGSYRFLVSARNEDGKWSETVTEMRFTVLPYFHQTPIFYFLVASVLGALVFGIFRWRVYSIKSRNQELSDLVVSQTDELRSINAALADQKEEVERTNEELLAQHSHLADANSKLEDAHMQIKKANEDLLRSNQQLEDKVRDRTKDLQTALDKVNRLNEELAIFIYRASHDLKGPTASLIGLALLGKMEGGSESQRYFERIEDTAVTMNKILSKLINIHGAITRKDVSQEPVVIADVVDEVRQITIGKSNDPVAFELDCGIHRTVCCDGTLLRIILENLIENALTFRRVGVKPVIKCVIRKINQEILVSVEDNGPGIEPENHERVFDLFFRASENSKGNGLGLYLVKKAVEKINGRIQLESAVNQFTRITVMFPESDESAMGPVDGSD